MALDLTGFNGPAECRHVLLANPSVLLTGRNSGEAGRAAYHAAAQDLIQAAEALDSNTGLQVARVLPTQAVLETMLRESRSVASVTPEGNKFTNRYLQWSSREHGVHVLLSAGSGRKVDEDLLQPALARTTEAFRVLRPGLVFAKRLDRLGRRPWAFGPLMELLEATGSWLGDEEGLRAPDELNNLMVFFTASRGKQTAESMPTMTRHGMASRTGNTMVNGRVAYHVAHPPPPGTTRLGMLSAGGGLGGILLVLDSPDYLPHPSEVATGMPQVFAEDGTRVDQVANVRWALSVLGRPEWSRRAVATELSRRQMSTYSLRANNGSSATVQAPAADATVFPILNTILNNLDLYETGRLDRPLSVEGVDDIVIENVIPPDGPWAQPEDFVRIRTWLREGKQRHDRHRTLSLTSVPALLAGEPARLLSSAARKHTEPGYTVTLRNRPFGRQPRQTREPVIPHAVLADSIVSAISRAGEIPLVLWQQPDTEDSQLQATITRLEMAVESIQSALRTILSQVTAVDESGAPRLSGPLLEDLNTEYARLSQTELPTTQQQLEDARHQLEDRRMTHAAENGSAHAADILRLVSALRDPHDISLAELWRQSIRDLTVTVNQERDAAHITDVTSWHGSVVFSHLSDRYAIPFSGVHRSGAGTKVDERVDAITTSLLEGIPYDQCSVERLQVLRKKVAEHLGLSPGQFLLGSCLDPRITRTAAHIHLQPNRSDKDLASELDEPVGFVSRIRQIYCHTPRNRSVWLQYKYTLVTRWHILAAKRHGLVKADDIPDCASANSAVSTLLDSIHAAQWTQVTPGTYRLKPCSYCGGHRRAPMRILEPDGLVCLDCRHDQQGLVWPADPYDQWLCAPELWGDPV